MCRQDPPLFRDHVTQSFRMAGNGDMAWGQPHNFTLTDALRLLILETTHNGFQAATSNTLWTTSASCPGRRRKPASTTLFGSLARRAYPTCQRNHTTGWLSRWKIYTTS